MNFTIKSKLLNENFDFFAPDGGGYIRLECGANTGTLGTQLCDGGDFRGSTLCCKDEEEFKAECRRWYRQRIAWMKKDGLI